MAFDRAAGLKTRTALGEALKAELATTPLNRVTVRRLTDAAGVTRQAFYYHFADVYDLAVWLFKAELTDRIMAHATFAEWSDGFLVLLLWMHQHREQTYQTIEALSHEDLERFLHRQFRHMMEAIVAELDEGLDLAPEDRGFVIDHFSVVVLGHLLHWLATDMDADPYVLVERIERILRGGVRRSLEEFAR